MIAAALFGLLSAALWASVDFASRIPSRKIGYYSTASYVQVVGFATLGIYILFSTSEYSVFGHYDIFLLAINFLVGVFNFLGFLFLYRGFSTGLMSVVSPISSSYPIITILLSVFVLGTTIASLQRVGISLVLFGIILSGVRIRELRTVRVPQTITASSSTKQTVPQTRFTRGLGSAIISCVSFGTLYLFLSVVTSRTDLILPVFFMRLSAAIISFALLVPLGIRLARPDMRTFAIIAFIGIFDTIGYLSFDAGIHAAGNSLPIVATLSGLVGVFTILLARLFYKERLEMVQWLGVIALTVGVLVVLYF